MAEERIADIVYRVRLPKNKGTEFSKTRKIELFRHRQFKPTPGQAYSRLKSFSPAPPNPYRRNGEGRFQEYWGQNWYRVRINGKWIKGPAQYTFFTRDEVLRRWFGF